MGLTFSSKPPRRVFRPRNLLILGVVLVVAGAAFWFVSNRSSDPGLPTAETDAFLKGWTDGSGPAMAADVDQPPADLETTAMSLVKSMPGSKATYTRTSLVKDKQGGGATATYHAKVDVGGAGPVEWDGTLHLARVKVNGETVWRVKYEPAMLFPGLAAGQRLLAKRTWPARASITAADGTNLAGTGSVITIGLEPDRVTKSLPQIKTLMKSLVGTEPAAIDAALHAPGVKPNFFVPIATVPDDARYTSQIRPQLFPVPGVFFRRTNGVVAATGVLGPQVIGKVGDITGDRLKALGAPYQVGDQVGLTGLQATFEKRLAGLPSVDVVIAGKGDATKTVKHFPGKAPRPVALTIDPKTQQAAESALAAVAQPAALVAVDSKTGGLRAIVSKPDGGFDRALEGKYPPGSTFKIVTSEALLASGKAAATPAPCPPVVKINGRDFHNFEGEASGSLDLAEAFKISCNNSFISLGDALPNDALTKAAGLFGFNTKWSLPINSFGGSYPTPKDDTERAASAIGQGRVEASPAQMASVAAAVASGQWHAPALTSEPAPDSPKVGAFSPQVVATLRAFMASTSQPGGTAANAGLPAGTFGKTGTAEFGNDNPPKTHAWYVGYRGDIAFAVVVEGGGIGGQVAAPLAAKFLTALG
jgi:cell division protein FtsI/penicillin-binding protein 2